MGAGKGPVTAEAWRAELEATHFGQGLDFNDLGFMRRGNLNELELLGEHTRAIGDERSALASTRWTAELQARSSDRGVRLPTLLVVEHALTFRDGDMLEIGLVPRSGGFDDLV